MEIFVVTPPDLTEQCQQVLSAIREFPCAASYAFKILGFPEFEQTRQYQRLLRDKFWPGEYRRLKNSISPGPFAFCLEEINLIVINPGHKGSLLVSVMHELGHVATYEDQTCKDIRRKLKPFARKMEIQFGGEQLFMQTIHLLAFQSEVIANKWVAAASLEVLTKDLQEACIRWRNPSGVKLRYCLGQGLHILRTYLAMNLKHELANEYQLEDVKKILSQILKVARYVSKSDKTIRRLSKQLPLN